MRRIAIVGLGAAIGLTAAGTLVSLKFLQHDSHTPPPRSQAAAAKLAYEDAKLGDLQRRIVVQPDDTEGMRTLAHEWIARGKLSGDGGDFAQALHVLDQAETQEPGSLRLLIERVRVFEAGHRFVSARRMAESGLARDPDDGELLSLAGDASLYSGDLAAAERYDRENVRTSPKSPSAIIGLSFWAELSGDLEQAVTVIKQAPDVGYPTPLSHERQAYVHSVLGEINSKQGAVEEARREFELSLQIEPDYALADSGLSDLEQWEGHDEQAEALLRGLIDRESPNADYQIKLADLLDRRGRHSEAKVFRADAERFFTWSISTGYNGYLRPLAILKLAEGDYRAAAELAMRDLPERPSAESRTIYHNILRQARESGHPIDENQIREALNDVHVAANP